MFSVVCGVRGGPLVQWNVSLFPTESYFLSCFHFSRWKDWFWLSCSFLFIPHWRPSTTSVQSEELWKHALFYFFYLFKSQAFNLKVAWCLAYFFYVHSLTEKAAVSFQPLWYWLTSPSVGIQWGKEMIYHFLFENKNPPVVYEVFRSFNLLSRSTSTNPTKV